MDRCAILIVIRSIANQAHDCVSIDAVLRMQMLYGFVDTEFSIFESWIGNELLGFFVKRMPAWTNCTMIIELL